MDRGTGCLHVEHVGRVWVVGRVCGMQAGVMVQDINKVPIEQPVMTHFHKHSMAFEPVSNSIEASMSSFASVDVIHRIPGSLSFPLAITGHPDSITLTEVSRVTVAMAPFKRQGDPNHSTGIDDLFPIAGACKTAAVAPLLS